jgi:poly(3-hydroxybutyrate) depolymerase
MFSWISRTALRLRTWLAVRIALWRGRWRRRRVTVPEARLFPGWLANDTWTYGLYAPAGLRDDEAAPLVVVLHGCRQRALAFAHAAGWTQAADRLRVRLLCPDQRRRANLWRCWNWFLRPAQRGNGEVHIVLAMLEDAAAVVSIDDGALGAVGISAGGALAALLAFHHPERFRAVAAVAAPPLLGTFHAQDPRRVMRDGLAGSALLALDARQRACAPLAVIHGEADRVVNPRCGEQLVEQALASQRRAGLPADVHESEAPTEEGRVTEHRAGGALRVRHVRVPGLGHAWSGGPGGHAYCERGGAALTRMCVDFLRDAGVFAQGRP